MRNRCPLTQAATPRFSTRLCIDWTIGDSNGSLSRDRPIGRNGLACWIVWIAQVADYKRLPRKSTSWYNGSSLSWYLHYDDALEFLASGLRPGSGNLRQSFLEFARTPEKAKKGSGGAEYKG